MTQSPRREEEDPQKLQREKINDQKHHKSGGYPQRLDPQGDPTSLTHEYYLYYLAIIIIIIIIIYIYILKLYNNNMLLYYINT